MAAIGLLLASCGGSHTRDDAGEIEPRRDAVVARCDPHDAFADVRHVGIPPDTLLQGSGIWIAPSELTAYFVRTEPDGGSHVVRATRASRGETFVAASVLPVEWPRGKLALSGDERTLYYDGEVGGGLHGLRRTTRTDPSAAFPPSDIVGHGINPFMTPAYLYYFQHQDADDAPALLHRTDATGRDEVLFDGREPCGPVAVSVDDDVVYCGSQGDGRIDTDIVALVRTAMPSTYEEMIPAPELTTEDFESPASVSADLCRLYFLRTAPSSGVTTSELLVAERAPRAH